MKNLFGLQYIMDGNGNYYKVNDHNQLVVASGRDDAEEFSFFDANQRIGGGKNAMIYFTIPVEGNVSVEQASTKNDYMPKVIDGVNKNNRYDIAYFDWSDYLWQFCYMASMVERRQDELTNELSEVDKEICDILHLVELYKLEQDEELRTVELLKDARQRRRNIKDEMMCLEYFHTSFGTEKNIAEAKSIIKQIKKLDHRVYKPRKLPELFSEMKGREIERVFYVELEKRKMDEINFVEITDERKEEPTMAYERKETIFDTRENDWLSFAKQQFDFYQNAPQYMINLQIEIEAINQAIEEALVLIEDANYNVAQGYKAFKKLKDLRNECKEKQREFNCLSILTQGVDFAYMIDIFANNISQAENIKQEESRVRLLEN